MKDGVARKLLKAYVESGPAMYDGGNDGEPDHCQHCYGTKGFGTVYHDKKCPWAVAALAISKTLPKGHAISSR